MYVWCFLCTIALGYFFHSFIVIWSIHKCAPDLFLKFMCFKMCRTFYRWPLSSALELISCLNPLWVGGRRQDSAVNVDTSNITSLPSPYMYLACFLCSCTVLLKSKVFTRQESRLVRRNSDSSWVQAYIRKLSKMRQL